MRARGLKLCLLLLALPAGAQAPLADAGPPDAGEADEESPLDGPDDVDLEAERPTGSSDGGLIYTSDLSDEELGRRFLDDLPSLGSISVGVAEAGRLVNGVQMPAGEAWTVVAPEAAWGARETVDSLALVARAVKAQFPNASPLRINHIGKREGGYLRPHFSHQSGRDVDLGFYYREGINPAAPKMKREDAMDLGPSWALVKALATQVDVQVVLLDRRVQRKLFDYALARGEDRVWLDGLFGGHPDSLFQHARRHRDHFHVRFFAARSQELGRRVIPLLARRQEENVIIHRVQRGDSLLRLALRYGSSVKLIQKANGLSGTGLRVGRTLNVPLRGPCTQCPVPPAVVLPPRHLPPVMMASIARLPAPAMLGAEPKGAAAPAAAPNAPAGRFRPPPGFTASVSTVPGAVFDSPTDKPSGYFPTHLQVALKSATREGFIDVLPIKAWRAVYQEGEPSPAEFCVGGPVLELKNLLAAPQLPATLKDPPVPACLDGATPIGVLARRVDFVGGSGVLYLTQLFIEAVLPSNALLEAWFLGLTHDGKTLVWATVPVRAEGLREEDTGLVGEGQARALVEAEFSRLAQRPQALSPTLEAIGASLATFDPTAP